MVKKYFSNKYSKIFTLNAILKTLNETEISSDKLIVHTANGIYVGTLKEQEDYDNLEIQKSDDILTVYRKMYLNSLNAFENSDKSSNIEKIQVLTSSRIINLPFVEIFVDQIIGFSLGSISQ